MHFKRNKDPKFTAEEIKNKTPRAIFKDKVNEGIYTEFKGKAVRKKSLMKEVIDDWTLREEHSTD